MKMPKIFGRSLSSVDSGTHPPLGGAQGYQGHPSVTPDAISHVLGPVRIYRHVTMDVETFDVFKDWGRWLSHVTGFALTNSEVLRMLVLAHPTPSRSGSRPAPPLTR